MHTVTETVAIISHVTGKLRGRVAEISRRLIDDGVLPKSSGRAVVRIDHSSAVLLLFAAARADRVADASKTATEFAALPHRHNLFGLDPAESKPVKTLSVIKHELKVHPGLTLAECLAGLLAPDATDRCTLGLAKDASGRPSAVVKIHLQNGANSSMLFFEDDTADSWSRETFTLSADAFDALRDLLAREGGVSFVGAATGWGGDG